MHARSQNLTNSFCPFARQTRPNRRAVDPTAFPLHCSPHPSTPATAPGSQEFPPREPPLTAFPSLQPMGPGTCEFAVRMILAPKACCCTLDLVLAGCGSPPALLRVHSMGDIPSRWLVIRTRPARNQRATTPPHQPCSSRHQSPPHQPPAQLGSTRVQRSPALNPYSPCSNPGGRCGGGGVLGWSRG